jgi:prolyl-tRNA synthetase
VEETLADMKVTIRCLPLEAQDEPGKCIFTGKPSQRRAVFAKAY